MVMENALFRYVIATNAVNERFQDRVGGKDYLRTDPPSSCALIRSRGVTQEATAAVFADGRLALRFGATGVDAVLKVDTHPFGLVFTVESVSGPEVESLTFLNVPLVLSATPSDAFGACALSLNLQTRVDALPALQRELRASGERKFGLVGARAAIVAAPMSRMLVELQATLTEVSELPICKVAGPWARETPFNRGSYLFNFGTLYETNVAHWIERMKVLGFTQVDHHGGGSFFRFGDLEMNRQHWPKGWDSFAPLVGQLHRAGIGSILHTYAFFIDKQSKYVTPVPDSRLDAFRSFSLAEPLAADASEMVVSESTEGMTTRTGFFEFNSVVLHVGDELITFGGATQEAPWKFTGLKRGAFGTKAVSHAKTIKARHLKECFGLFVPNVETTLFGEIAANHAEVVNRCGFEGLYLDAIDGSAILRGADESWYWATQFVVEIQKRLKQPVGMEMSAMWHPFWQYRTRWQAWDLPRRGHKRFVDLHAAEVNGGLLLPLHLGWWGFSAFDPPQTEPTFPDVMEYLGAKLVGWDAGVSLTSGVDPEALRATPLYRRGVDILRACETLRHSRTFDESAKALLREPGKEFALFTNAAGHTRFRRVQSHTQTIAHDEDWTHHWRVTNEFGAQPVRFRLQALMAAGLPADSSRGPVAILGPESAGRWKPSAAEGVTFRCDSSADVEQRRCRVLATNKGLVARNAAWARLETRFDPWLNIKQHQALAVEIEGDGSGALLAFRLQSPHHMAYGGVADYYVPLDFAGLRRVTLVETESTRWSDYVWNDAKHLYHVYREMADFGAIESLSVCLQNLPPGRETTVVLGEIRALPLREVPVDHPKLTLNGKTLELPVVLSAGSWIEGQGSDDCTIFSGKGEMLGKLMPLGDWLSLRAGVNELSCAVNATQSTSPRWRVVTFAQGEPL